MADKGLFPRLRRLFSTDVIIRNTGGNQLNVFDINKIQQSGEIETNSLVDRFNRIYSNSSTSLLGDTILLVLELKVTTKTNSLLSGHSVYLVPSLLTVLYL